MAVSQSASEIGGVSSILAIDYDLLGEKMANALEKVSVSMDGKKVGNLTGNTVNESFQRQSNLEKRGVL